MKSPDKLSSMVSTGAIYAVLLLAAYLCHESAIHDDLSHQVAGLLEGASKVLLFGTLVYATGSAIANIFLGDK